MDLGEMASMQQAVQRMQQQMGGQTGGSAGSGPQNVVLEKKVDETGPAMLGLPTQHLVYEVSYHQGPSLPNAPTTEVHEKYELWATRGLDSRFASIPALKRAGELAKLNGSGGAEPREVSEALASHGFILKQSFSRESKTTAGATMPMMGPMALMMRGRGTPRTVSSMAFTAIRDESLPAERFVLPKGYAEVEMMNPNMGAMPDLSKLPGAAVPGAVPAGASPPGNGAQPMPDLNNIPK
jgi:hypothetical protein